MLNVSPVAFPPAGEPFTAELENQGEPKIPGTPLSRNAQRPANSERAGISLEVEELCNAASAGIPDSGIGYAFRRTFGEGWGLGRGRWPAAARIDLTVAGSL